jgi:hypothetical protein
MHKILQIGTLGLAGLTTTGLIAFTAPAAVASDGHRKDTVFKRDDDGGSVVTTARHGDDDDDDDATNAGSDTNTNAGTNTNDTNTNTGAGAAADGDDTGASTRGQNTDHSRGAQVRDMTNDGPGSGNVDHSRDHTNDNSRHNTRG